MTIAEKLLRAKQDYDEVQSVSYSQGYDEGYHYGSHEGYDEGYDYGYDAGVKKVIEEPITDLEIPTNTKSLRPYCFYKCDGLESIYLPPAIQLINESAFEACNGITSLIIPTGLSIGKNAFANMASLETVHFSGKAKSIHPLAFVGASVTDIYVPWNEGDIGGAPWGAYDATIHYKVTNFVSVIYDNSNPLTITSNKNIDNINYQPKTGSFKTVNNALVWERGNADPQILSPLGSVATMYSDRINYDVVISRNGDAEPIQLQFALRSKYKTDGTTLSKTLFIYQWETNGSGQVIFKPTGEVITTITNEPTHIRTSIDFRLGTISYCDENFNPIKTGTFTVNTISGANSVNEWRKCFNHELFRFYSKSYGDSIRIHSIEVSEGAVEYTLLPDECFVYVNFLDTSTDDPYDGWYGIDKYSGTSPTVIIPKTHKNKLVECIGNFTFAYDNIDGGQVFLPSTIEKIYASAFAQGGFKEIFVPWSEGEDKLNPAPWGATDATIHYDYNTDGFY